MRRPLVAANWKMNGLTETVQSLLQALTQAMGQDSDCDVVICPPSLYICQSGELLADSGIGLGAQNVSQQDAGAFTGEVSAGMLTDCGCAYVIVGHSERRELFGETSQLVAQKFAAAQRQGLIPILCVGETLEQREAGSTEQVVLDQLDQVLALNGIEAFADAVIAYEPVWAIGTGLSASPEQAQQVHALIRKRLTDADETVGNAVRLLYGGSVKAANAAELFAQPDIDGGLVGGASLIAEEFIAICSAVNSEREKTG